MKSLRIILYFIVWWCLIIVLPPYLLPQIVTDPLMSIFLGVVWGIFTTSILMVLMIKEKEC